MSRLLPMPCPLSVSTRTASNDDHVKGGQSVAFFLVDGPEELE